ncbi:M14 family zinc carboxypeptidase [Hydrogenophaga sp. 5NK40-0174]|uniref:M14 family zinc carboxypeptidase n=1 Tax=Hydrogenophaga sp. 5NK40-0174 TaxID=3127649 RepID=UPI00333F30CE
MTSALRSVLLGAGLSALALGSAAQSPAKTPADGSAKAAAQAEAPEDAPKQTRPQHVRGPGHPYADVPGSGPCQELVARLPNVKKPLCEAAELVPTVGRSVQGRTLYQRDVVSGNPKIKVLVIGAMHGDELSSAAVALHWIQHATEMSSNAHWRFIPALNPDGLMKRPATRTNAAGVDLNRNFPTPDWDRDALKYWKNRTRKDKRRYPGPYPLSEPESQYLYDEIERFDPDLLVSIHAPYGVLDFDGPTVPPDRLGRLYLDQVGIYPGSLGNFGGVHKGMPVVTVELNSAFRTPLNAEMRQMWLDLLRWMGEHVKPEGQNRARPIPVDGSEKDRQQKLKKTS